MLLTGANVMVSFIPINHSLLWYFLHLDYILEYKNPKHRWFGGNHVEFYTSPIETFISTYLLTMRSSKVVKNILLKTWKICCLKYLLISVALIITLGIIFSLPEAANSNTRALTLTIHDKSYKIEYPSFENYIKSEENATSETSINLNATNTTISLNRGDVIDVHSDFKLEIAAIITVSLFQGSEVMITDGTNNIQFDGKMIPILKLDNYPKGYSFQIKIPEDIKSGSYKMIISFSHSEGLTYYTPTIVVN